MTDCKSVKDIARSGRAKATSAAQLHARIWAITFSHTDGEVPSVEWMPSHASREGIGTLRIGDGSRLIERQWRFNQLVDEHAKTAAAAVRHSEGIRKVVREAQERVATMAQWIARVTHAANNGLEPPCRDSEPTAARKTREAEGGDRRKLRGSRDIVQRPAQLGGHELVREAGKWRCISCKKSTKNRAQLAPARCEGSAAAKWARRAKALGMAGGSDGAGHLRAAIGDVTWCLRCGSYAVSWAVGLAAPCAGAPMNPSQWRVRGRLLRGRHPRTNARLQGEMIMEVAGEGRDRVEERNRGSGGRLGREEVVADGSVVSDAPLHSRKRKRGLEGGMQPRSTAGYWRRPGGAKPAFEDALGGQVEDQGGRRRGHGAAPVDRAITQGLVARMAEAIEAGARAAMEVPQVANRDGSLRRGSGDMGGNESQTPEVPTNRRRLLEGLKEKVEEAKRRRKAEAA